MSCPRSGGGAAPFPSGQLAHAADAVAAPGRLASSPARGGFAGDHAGVGRVAARAYGPGCSPQPPAPAWSHTARRAVHGEESGIVQNVEKGLTKAAAGRWMGRPSSLAMFTFRRFLSCALLLPLAAFAGCSLLPSGPPPPQKREVQGGFTVRVDGPGLPGAAGVATDIGAFAQRRGFVRQSAKVASRTDPVTHEPLPAAPDRYVLGNMVLEVSRQPDDHRVTAYLHGFGRKDDRKFIEGFYRGFDHEYAGRYGGEDRISESAYADDSGASFGSPGTLGPGGGTPESDSPRVSGVPPVSPGGPGGVGGPSGLGGPSGIGGASDRP